MEGDLDSTHLPLQQEASSSASKERIMCETVNKVDRTVEEVDKLECEDDSLNKEVSSSFHSYCHCLICLVVTCSPLGLKMRLRMFKAIKIYSTTSFGREVEPGSHVIHLLFVKEIFPYDTIDTTFVTHKFPYSAPSCRHVCMTEETCDRQE
jgi:hypothetical protein